MARPPTPLGVPAGCGSVTAGLATARRRRGWPVVAAGRPGCSATAGPAVMVVRARPVVSVAPAARWPGSALTVATVGQVRPGLPVRPGWLGSTAAPAVPAVTATLAVLREADRLVLE